MDVHFIKILVSGVSAVYQYVELLRGWHAVPALILWPRPDQSMIPYILNVRCYPHLPPENQ